MVSLSFLRLVHSLTLVRLNQEVSWRPSRFFGWPEYRRTLPKPCREYPACFLKYEMEFPWKTDWGTCQDKCDLASIHADLKSNSLLYLSGTHNSSLSHDHENHTRVYQSCRRCVLLWHTNSRGGGSREPISLPIEGLFRRRLSRRAWSWRLEHSKNIIEIRGENNEISKSTYTIISRELFFKVGLDASNKPGTGVEMHTVKENRLHISWE